MDKIISCEFNIEIACVKFKCAPGGLYKPVFEFHKDVNKNFGKTGVSKVTPVFLCLSVVLWQTELGSYTDIQLKNFVVSPYCKNVKNNAKANIPVISKH